MTPVPHPAHDPAVVAGITRRLRRAAERLRAVPDEEVLDGLAAALASWRGEDGAAAQAAGELAAASGESPAMIRFGLERTVAAHRREELARWLREARSEVGGDPVTGEPRRFGPPLVVQVLAGNVAGLAIPAVAEALLARSAVLLKPAADDPVTPRLLRESLTRAAPLLAEAVAVLPWTGGDEHVEAVVFHAADLVVATGGAEAVRSIGRRASGRVVLHGPRFSVGIVGSAWRRRRSGWWEEMAREIVLWDQRGCLSPRILFVPGDLPRFARRLAGALAVWEERWPAPPRAAGTAAAIHAFRARRTMAPGGGVVEPRDTSWTVGWDDEATLEIGPPARVVRLVHRPRRGVLLDLLREASSSVQAVGLDGLGSRTLGWERELQGAGVGWLCPLTRIQDPPAGWRADGISGLVELLRAPADGAP